MWWWVRWLPRLWGCDTIVLTSSFSFYTTHNSSSNGVIEKDNQLKEQRLCRFYEWEVKASPPRHARKSKARGRRVSWAGVFETTGEIGRKKTIHINRCDRFKCEVASNCSALFFTASALEMQSSLLLITMVIGLLSKTYTFILLLVITPAYNTIQTYTSQPSAPPPLTCSHCSVAIVDVMSIEC